MFVKVTAFKAALYFIIVNTKVIIDMVCYLVNAFTGPRYLTIIKVIILRITTTNLDAGTASHTYFYLGSNMIDHLPS